MEQLRVPSEMFRFTSVDHSDLYLAILDAFAYANERLETALSLDDVKIRLRLVGWLEAIDDADLVAALGQLQDWKLVDVIQNHSENYRTASEHERRNLQYSLTERGDPDIAAGTRAGLRLHRLAPVRRQDRPVQWRGLAAAHQEATRRAVRRRKAIALQLPLFAAVAAHYQTVPRAPRLILLDEVFVGVDTSNRGQVFALLAALDLDLMLTSDHEWCTYAELDGIGIHQLITERRRRRRHDGQIHLERP